jgi:hypothetical protein
VSEERRKKQQQQSGTAGASLRLRKFATWSGVVVLLAAAYAAGWYRHNHRYDGFAKCLASKQAKMYGLYWCPHCAEQKEMFGKSFEYVPYVECAIKGSHDEAPECKAAGAKLFPSWQFGSDPPKEGVLRLEQLSEKTGCGLP